MEYRLKVTHMGYRLKVKCRSRWKLGVKVYPTLEAAEARKAELEAMGNKKVEIEPESKLFE